MNKYKAYRKRCQNEGKCPHCGKPCAPFDSCVERREYKNSWRRSKSKFNRSNWPDKMKQPRGPIRYWTEKEDYQLAVELKNGTPFKTICSNLNRTPWAIVARTRKLGLGKFNELQPLLHVLSMGIDL